MNIKHKTAPDWKDPENLDKSTQQDAEWGPHGCEGQRPHGSTGPRAGAEQPSWSPGCNMVARENTPVCRNDGHQVGSLFPSGSERKSFALCLQCEFETVSRFRIDGKAKEARDNEAHCTVPAHRTSWNGDVHLWWQGRVSVSWGRVGSTTKGHWGGFCGKEDSP